MSQLTNNSPSISRVIKAVLKAEKLTQKEFAEMVGLAAGTVNTRLNNDNWSYDVDRLREWFGVLGYEMDIVVWKKSAGIISTPILAEFDTLNSVENSEDSG